MKLNKNCNGIESYDEFVTYIGEGPASPCGLSFGPGGLYFTDLHGENGTEEKPSGSIYRIKPVG
jgi:aldose sugar dehydrogenase